MISGALYHLVVTLKVSLAMGFDIDAVLLIFEGYAIPA
jgi:hypothetical protein